MKRIPELLVSVLLLSRFLIKRTELCTMIRSNNTIIESIVEEIVVSPKFANVKHSTLNHSSRSCTNERVPINTSYQNHDLLNNVPSGIISSPMNGMPFEVTALRIECNNRDTNFIGVHAKWANQSPMNRTKPSLLNKETNYQE